MKDLQTIRENAALYLIWSNRVLSRGRISDILSLKPPTVSALIHDLINSGRVREGRLADSSGGRRAKLLEIVPTWGWVIGLEFSSRGIVSACARMNGDIYNIKQSNFESGAGRDKILKSLSAAIRYQINNIRKIDLAPIFRIGVAISGLVDEKTGISINFPRLEDWKDVPLKQIFEQEFGVLTVVENRITAITCAEHLFGEHKDLKDVLIFQMGPGLGMGIILNGKVRRGVKWSVGEFGHIAFSSDNGPLCYCGKRGCLESVASDYALVAQAKDAVKDGVNTRILDFAGSKDNITAEAICHAAEDGDRLAYNMLERVGYFLAMGVANLLNVLGPEAVLFGGSMIEPNDVLLDCIQRNLRVYTLEYIEKHVKVAKATFGSNQGIQGAITIALNDCYTKPQAGNSIG